MKTKKKVKLNNKSVTKGSKIKISTMLYLITE